MDPFLTSKMMIFNFERCQFAPPCSMFLTSPTTRANCQLCVHSSMV